MALRTLELCSGIGGLSLGLRLAERAARTVCHVEREAFSAAVLVKQMEAGRLDPSPIWSDVAAFDAGAWRGAVDLVAAGLPCQRPPIWDEGFGRARALGGCNPLG